LSSTARLSVSDFAALYCRRNVLTLRARAQRRRISEALLGVVIRSPEKGLLHHQVSEWDWSNLASGSVLSPTCLRDFKCAYDSRIPWPTAAGTDYIAIRYKPKTTYKEEIMADQQGTGKHPHKSTEEPYPHHRSGSSSENERRSASSENRNNEQRNASGSESRDLKEREYRDKDGNIHHHTHTSSEMQK
jgi:hypothetical protein